MLRFPLFPIALALFAIALEATAQVPAGGEFQVNVFTTGEQGTPRVAARGDGGFVVAWDGTFGVKGRVYAPDGTPQTGDLNLGSLQPGQGGAGLREIVSDARGNFAVAGLNYTGPASYQVILRRFRSSGSWLGETVVAMASGRSADFALSPSGGFVVVWERSGATQDIYGRRLSATGAQLGSEFRINTYTTGVQRLGGVAVDGQGTFVVVWDSDGQDGDARGVFGQRFDASGAPLGTELKINTYTSSNQHFPQVAATPDGRFVVTWTSYGQDGMWDGVFGQRFSAAGAPEGGEFQVNGASSLAQAGTDVAVDSAGNFTVAWMVSPLGENHAHRFDASGARRGSEFRLNTFTIGSQFNPWVASDGEGNLLAAWVSFDQDGSSSGVFAQRYGGLVPAALTVAAGNDVLEPGEAADVLPSWRNVNGQAQTFGGAAAGLTGPAGAVYTLTDGSAIYGTVANGAIAQCTDCYSVSISNPPARPALHWDAILEERITPDIQGQDKLWRLHVGDSFADVPRASPFYRFVETLLHRTVTAGCASAEYCPAMTTTREQMAVFVLVAKEGTGYAPPPCTAPVFADVPASSPFCRWIEELARRGVVGGCGGGNYCPASAVTREEMAVFVLLTVDPDLQPPACTTPLFADVPASSAFCRWIEELVRRGIVTGCGGGNYCPAAPVTREQMGVFIGVTFGLTLYGP